MMPAAVAGAAAVLVLVALRLIGVRAMGRRDGRFFWLIFVPSAFAAAVTVWFSIQVLWSWPLIGLPLGILAVLNAATLIRLISRVSRAVMATGPGDDIGAAAIEPFEDYAGVLTGVMLLGGLVAIVGLIILAVSQATR